MGIPTSDFSKAPLPHATADVEWNKMRSTLLGLQDQFSSNFTLNKSKRRQPYITDVFLATIQDSPPPKQTSLTNFTDSRYWLKRAVPDPGDADYLPDGTGHSKLATQDDPLNKSVVQPYWVMGTNLAERPLAGTSSSNAGTHQLPADTDVLVFAIADPTNPIKKWYVFNQSVPMGRFIVTGHATRAGMYTAHTFTPPATVNAFTADAPTSASMGSAMPDTVYLANRTEYDKLISDDTQWDLPTGRVCVGAYLCQSTDGTPVYEIEAYNLGNCSLS